MVFAVIAGTGHEAALEDRILKAYPKFMRLNPGPGQWLLSASGTAKEVSDALGISAGRPDDIPLAIVLSVSGFWGRQTNDIWEWMAANWSNA